MAWKKRAAMTWGVVFAVFAASCGRREAVKPEQTLHTFSNINDGLNSFIAVDDSGFRLPTTDGALHWIPRSHDCYVTFWINKKLGTVTLPEHWCVDIQAEAKR